MHWANLSKIANILLLHNSYTIMALNFMEIWGII